MNIRKLASKPKVFGRIFGLSPEQFRELAKELEPRWKETETIRKTSKKRERAVGAGRKYVLTFEQSLAMHLLYLRTYSPYVFIGMIFRIDDATVTRYFQKLRPIMAERMQKLRIKRIAIPEEEILSLIADATEQETERRTGSGYSGKKKQQTVKTQIIVNRKGEIRHVSSSVPGNTHDKKLYDQTKAKAGLGDLGYLGTNLSVPHKASKFRKLTEKEKQRNRRHSLKRIVVEHVFACLKKWRILSNRFRNDLSCYNDIFLSVCGLYNLKLA